MISNYKEIKLTDNIILNVNMENIYYLSEGTVQLWELHSDGTEILISVLKTDDAIRLHKGNFDNVYEFRTVKGEAHFFIYTWDPISALEEKYFLLNKVAMTLMRTETLNLIKRKKFVKDRLISLLQYLVQEYGERREDNYFAINLLLTHEELASLILSTRTTVTRILNELKKDNLITYIHGHICLNQNIIGNIDERYQVG